MSSSRHELTTLLELVDDVLATADSMPAVAQLPGTDVQAAVMEPELVDQDETVDGEAVDDDVEQKPEPVRAPRRWWWVRRPAVDTAADDAAQQLSQRLGADRAVVQVGRHDEVVRKLGAATHEEDQARVQQWRTTARQARRQQAKDAAEQARLDALYRRASREGHRAKIRAAILSSAEMRALRLARVRTATLIVLLPVLLVLAGFSTAGAQAGAAELMNLIEGTPMWQAAWGIEPALITIVAYVIVVRAILHSSGGRTDWKATAIEWGALGMSLWLNVVGGWQGDWSWAGVGTGLVTALPHAVGPLGCAGTAFLIGLIDGYVSTAKPWDNAESVDKLLDTLKVDRPQSPQVPPVPQLLTAPVPPVPPVPAAVPVPGAVPLPARTAAGTAGTGGRRHRPVPATGTRRPMLTARTGQPAQPGTAKAAARAFWDTEVKAGRTPTGTDLARAAGRDGDPTGVFRRYARDWAAELLGAPRDAAS
jgi:hypothetical protein